MELTNEILQKALASFKKALELVGFSSEAVDSQISELGEVILMAILARLKKDKNLDFSRLSPEKFEEFLNQNYSEPNLKTELKKIVEEEALNKIQEYAKEVTKVLPEEKKELFYKTILSF